MINTLDVGELPWTGENYDRRERIVEEAAGIRAASTSETIGSVVSMVDTSMVVTSDSGPCEIEIGAVAAGTVSLTAVSNNSYFHDSDGYWIN